MTLTRRPSEPTIMPLRSVLGRLIEDWPPFQVEDRFTELGPPIDVRDTDDAYIVEIDLPGADPENTEVFIEGRTLTVRGEFCDESEHDEGNYLLRERRHGEFVRAVALPGMVEVNEVSSRFENGRLTIMLPKANQNRARRVQIASGNGNGNEARSGDQGRMEASSTAPNERTGTQSASGEESQGASGGRSRSSSTSGQRRGSGSSSSGRRRTSEKTESGSST